MAEWFRRKSKNIKTFDKRDTQEGSWIKCTKCSEMIYRKVLEKNTFVCQNCNYHYRVRSDEYIKLLIDNNEYTEYCSDDNNVNIFKLSGTLVRDIISNNLPNNGYLIDDEIYKYLIKQKSSNRKIFSQ